jgi:hypothetical protein
MGLTITITTQIKKLLAPYTSDERESIITSAWDACCDGDWIDFKHGDLEEFDPWDGEHEELREEIELEAVTASLPVPTGRVLTKT